MRMVGRIWA